MSLPIGLVAFRNAASARPPEVPHDGIHVVQPLDPNELAKCPTGGSGAAPATPDLLERSSFGAAPTSFLRPGATGKAAARKTNHQRMALACAAGCSTHEPQLEDSLSPWAEWKTNASGLEMIEAVEGFCSDKSSKDPFVMTVLWKGDVYLKACKAESVQSVGLYLIGPEDLSLVLILLFGAQRIGNLPEGPIAFGMYLSDYTSLLDRHSVGPGLPIFSYLGRDTSWLIPWPSSFTLLSTQDVEAYEKKDSTQKSWRDRTSKAYWIGAVTGPWDFALDDGLMAVPRVKLLKMAHEHPQELEAEWSSTAGYGIAWVKDDYNVSGFLAKRPRSIAELTGITKSKYKDVDDWENFKYYVNLDGVVMGGRLNKLLSLGGVVLQHQAGYMEHTNALMKPYEHYVPIEYDLSDLVEKVQWLQKNDAEAKRIAENGKALAAKRMRFEDDVCYVWRALEALGTKTASAPVVDSEVQKRLQDYVRASVQDGGMRQTMEAFWGVKLEDIATGNRRMTSRGIDLLGWAWQRMAGLYERAQGSL